jgi:dephospho-CoA kinase
MTVCVGVTGGICSGKSSVTKHLKARNIPVIDADQLGHRAYAPGTSCFQRLVEQFGESIVAEDGSINRRALGGIVFSDKSKMEELNAIVWPEIRTLIIQELDRARAEAIPLVVVEAAIMIEAHWYDLFDQVWVVCTDETTALQRLCERNGLTEEQARQRLAAQTSNEERKKHAHGIIDNNDDDTIESLVVKVDALIEQVR